MTQIQPSEIRWYLSNPMATTGYSGVGTAGNSLGNFMSTTQVSSTPLDALFLDITGPQNANLQVDYACLFLMNATSSGNTMLDVYIWLPSTLCTSGPGAATVAVGVDPIGPVPYNSTSQQAQTIPNVTTAPTGVSTWVGPQSVFSSGLSVANVPANYVLALWLQRTAVGGQAVNNDTLTIQAVFGTNA